MANRWRIVALSSAAAAFCVIVATPWHGDVQIRKAVAIVAATLILWISEAAPLGVTALIIPVAATFTGVLPWPTALASWGDPILFLFLGTFLLARALEKHGVLSALSDARWARGRMDDRGPFATLIILLTSGAVSSVQNNTAVTAMFLPVILRFARMAAAPAILLLALAYGSTFGGMATPVGTAPNFIGYAAMKKLDGSVTFLSWLSVGVPVWLGTTMIGWLFLELARRLSKPRFPSDRYQDVPHAVGSSEGHASIETPTIEALSRQTNGEQRIARRWSVAAFLMTALIWLCVGAVISVTDASSPAQAWVKTYLPESLVPVALAWVLFMVRTGPRGGSVLERDDLQGLDWDTLFLIAGGLCLGNILSASGSAQALAGLVGRSDLPPFALMLVLGGVTVLLSELTSNTATAALMVPLAGSMAEPLGLSPVQAIWLVALAASLGFAMPVSTPPNAIVYGTRLIPLRTMVWVGILVDIFSLFWLVCCIRWWG